MNHFKWFQGYRLDEIFVDAKRIFFEKRPTDKTTYDLPYITRDASVTNIREPVCANYIEVLLPILTFLSDKDWLHCN
jgi:hypothetical protein